MFCSKCGKENRDDVLYCMNCGTKLSAGNGGWEAPVMAPAAPEVRYSRPNPAPTLAPPVTAAAPAPAAPIIPDEYKPMSPWGFFGFSLLFAIPFVGLILLIVFACGASSNKCLKNYARSYFCGLIILGGLALVLLMIAAIAGVSIASMF